MEDRLPQTPYILEEVTDHPYWNRHTLQIWVDLPYPQYPLQPHHLSAYWMSNLLTWDPQTTVSQTERLTLQPRRCNERHMTVILPSTPRRGQSNRLVTCPWKGSVRWMPWYSTKVPLQERRTYSPTCWDCWQQIGLSCQPFLGTVPTKGIHSPKGMNLPQGSHDWLAQRYKDSAFSPQLRTESQPNSSLCSILVPLHSFPSKDSEPKALPNKHPTH